ncbi:EAL and HDOD domain-containing protein [Limisalsivibrio acetivorans]|uniref:EAL and HDOD domain-containing protein n=1 Tax=Limisalsivibrio acetivorans TaxID=1304888 RepID=UPI0003B66830|nr:EAL domain-containing protein [Limisalsivibrio acetivorans]
MSKDWFIGRQPILDREEKITAYEILFRSGNAGGANVQDNLAATSSVLVNTLQNFGVENLLQEKTGFINIDETVLDSGVLDILPPEKFILELLETTKVDFEVLQKVHEYKEKGFSFALDDFIFEDEYLNNFKELYDVVDVIKVDFMDSDRKKLIDNMEMLKGFKVKLLAEKVETREEFELCKELGFDLFQGYYFAKPSMLSKKKDIDPSKLAIINLVNMLRKDTEIEDLEKELKANPELNLSLLKFINSSAFFLRSSVNSIRHAISLLGRTNLSKWLTLLLYATGDADPDENPLLQTAQIRAKTLEALLSKGKGYDSDFIEKAYLAGLLSILDVVFSAPFEDFIDQFNISEEIKAAVTDGEGRLGKLLDLMQKVEEYDIAGFNEILDEFGFSMEQLSEARLEGLT